MLGQTQAAIPKAFPCYPSQCHSVSQSIWFLFIRLPWSPQPRLLTPFTCITVTVLWAEAFKPAFSSSAACSSSTWMSDSLFWNTHLPCHFLAQRLLWLLYCPDSNVQSRWSRLPTVCLDSEAFSFSTLFLPHFTTHCFLHGPFLGEKCPSSHLALTESYFFCDSSFNEAVCHPTHSPTVVEFFMFNFFGTWWFKIMKRC